MHVPTDHEVDELLDVRELLEVQTARLAARSASRAAVARLRVIWHEGEHAVATGDTESVVAANNRFHAELARVAGNAVLADLAGIVSRRVRWYYRQVAPLRGHESWAEHAELIDAVAAGDRSGRPRWPGSTPSAPVPPTTSHPLSSRAGGPADPLGGGRDHDRGTRRPAGPSLDSGRGARRAAAPAGTGEAIQGRRTTLMGSGA